MTERLGAYSPETARLILETVKYLRGNGYVLQGTEQQTPQLQPAPILFKNSSGFTIPKYGVVQFTGTIVDGDVTYQSATIPQDSTAENGPFAINGHEEVASGEFGMAQNSDVMRVKSEFFDAGSWLSPKPGSFTLGSSYTGLFTIIGQDTTIGTSGIARAMRGGYGIAELVCITKTSSGWSLDEFYNGFDPLRYFNGIDGPLFGNSVTECLDSCLEEGDHAMAVFDVNTPQYVVITSESGVQGNVTRQDVIINAQLKSDSLEFERLNIPVACTEDASPIAIPLTDCDDDESPPPCECVYTWNGESWNMTSSCPDGCGNCTGPPLFPGTTVGQTSSFGCSGG